MEWVFFSSLLAAVSVSASNRCCELEFGREDGLNRREFQWPLPSTRLSPRHQCKEMSSRILSILYIYIYIWKVGFWGMGAVGYRAYKRFRGSDIFNFSQERGGRMF